LSRSFCFLWLNGPATVVVAAPSLAAARSIVREDARKKKESDAAKDLTRIVSSSPELTIETRSTEWAGIVFEHHLMTAKPDDIRGAIYYVNADPVKPRGNPNKIGGLWPPRRESSARRPKRASGRA